MRLSPEAGSCVGGDEDRRLNIAGDVVKRLNSSFMSGKSKPYEYRKSQLENLLRFLDENTDVLCDALWKDLHKSRTESMMMEIEVVKNEIRSALGNLKEWMAPHPVEKNVATLVDYPYIAYEPYGVALIIGAWNYPVNVLLSPLIGAIAAGNCAVLKPSEVSEHTERALDQLLPQYLDKDCFETICGGPEDTGLLLKQRFDYIFYTGSTTVGKIVYEAAAKHLTPVTLELGGKSPVWVDDDVDLTLTAKRIMWGKLLNAGQTCIAPDYVLCTSDMQDKLVDAMKTVTKSFMSDPKSSGDYGRIISSRQFERLSKLLKTQTIAFGGDLDAATKYISPTVLTNVDPASEIMQQEIFGPILPIVPIRDLDAAISFINHRDKPLAAYAFSKNNKNAEKFLKETTSGGACVNDVLMHTAVDSLPFGGVGASGVGGYHGFYSFETFSHKRSVLWKKHGLDFLLRTRYPPYNEENTKFTKMLLKYRRPLLPKWIGTVAIFGVGAAAGYLIHYLVSHNPYLLHQTEQI